MNENPLKDDNVIPFVANVEQEMLEEECEGCVL